MTPKNAKGGYKQVALWSGGKPHWRMIHRLVWEAFHDKPIPDGMQINHLNGDPADNRLANLEVCTPSENVVHAIENWGRPINCRPIFGHANGSAKLTGQDVRAIRAEYSAGGIRQIDLARKFGVSQKTISLITRGEIWPID